MSFFNDEKWLVVLLLFAANVFLVGCNSEIAGLRFAPAEEIKQSGQVTNDLALGLAFKGTPVVRALNKAAPVAACYAGRPENPVDVSGILAQEFKNYETKNKQISAAKLKQKIHSQTAQLVSDELAAILNTIATNEKLKPVDILPRVQAVVKIASMGSAIAAGIPIPSDPALTDSEKANNQKFDLILAKIASDGSKLASRKVTGLDASEIARESFTGVSNEAKNWLGTINTQMPWLLPSLGLGGLGAGGIGIQNARKKGKQAADSDGRATEAEKTAKIAQANAAAVQQAANNVMTRAVDQLGISVPISVALKDNVNNQATSK